MYSDKTKLFANNTFLWSHHTAHIFSSLDKYSNIFLQKTAHVLLPLVFSFLVLRKDIHLMINKSLEVLSCDLILLRKYDLY